MNKFNQKKIKQKGFTLVEIMVALGIFSIVMVVALGAVLAIVGANKKAQTLHNVINNLNLSIETMVRDLRTGFDYNCDDGGDCPNGAESVTFQSMQFPDDFGEPQEESYFRDGTKIYKTLNNQTTALTSDEVEIEKMTFFVSSTKREDSEQPRILLIIKGKAKIGQKVSDFNIQTFISQRKLDI